MDEFNKKKIKNPNKKYVVIIVILIGALAVTIARMYFLSKEVNEMQTPLVSSVSFSGEVFNIDSNEVNSISITNGSNGKSEEIYDRDRIEKAVDCLNTFSANSAIVRRPFMLTGFSYMIVLETEDETLTYTFEPYAILSGDLWYLGEGNHFQELIDMVDNAPSQVE